MSSAQPPGLSFPEYPANPAYAISSPSPRTPDPGPREQLAAFEAAILDGLLSRLPKGWSVTVDFVSDRWSRGQDKGYVCWVYDSRSREVDSFEWNDIPDEEQLQDFYETIAREHLALATGERRS